MNRLDAQLKRLYAAPEPSHGRTRALVLAVHGPGAWDALASAWTGVQADLQLPAPGIAVDGRGLQLWFSAAEPLPADVASRFLAGLRRRYLAELPRERVVAHPGAGDLPPREVAPGRWSAFVAPDLAGIFGDEPWIDILPGLDAQAELLSRLQVMQDDELQRALDQLGPDGSPSASQPADASATAAPIPAHADARSFLLAVMNDPTVALPLRIDAAKALLAGPALRDR